MESVIVIQHCQSEHHVNGLVGGWTDTPLTELGRQQAQQVAVRLHRCTDIGSFGLYSSDLLRAHQTAEIVGQVLQKQVTAAPALRELNLGSATGKTRKWFDEHRSPFPPRGRLDHRLLHDAETIRGHFNRVAEYLDSLVQQQIRNAIIVTHGGTVVHIMCWWLGIPIDVQDSFYAAGMPGGVTLLSKDAQTTVPVLVCFNELSHLTQTERGD